jgi:hypothetical protein
MYYHFGYIYIFTYLEYTVVKTIGDDCSRLNDTCTNYPEKDNKNQLSILEYLGLGFSPVQKARLKNEQTSSVKM